MANAGSRRERILLAIAALSTTFAIGLALLFASRWLELGQLRAELLAKGELQRELLAEASSDRVVYPHISREIGYVLNPNAGRGSWRAAPGDDYAINSLGLRGAEIGPKPQGKRRLLLVGDSVLFGWKLRDSQTVAASLERLLERMGIGASIDIVTVALPGWNVTSEDAFLRHHLPLLEPDFVIWSVLRNDFFDTGGVVPPGVLAGFASLQGRPLAPIAGANAAFHRELDMPFVRERWHGMVERIRAFHGDYGHPTALMYWRSTKRPYLDHVLSALDYQPPLLVVPEAIKQDARWPISDRDDHPSAWGTEQLAVGIAELIRAEAWVAGVAFDEDEARVADAFRAESDRTSSPAEREAFLAAQLLQLPSKFDPNTSEKAVLFGIEERAMQREGTVYLRPSAPASGLSVDFVVPDLAGGPPLRAKFSLLDRQGARSSQSVTLAGGASRVELLLPVGSRTDSPLELRWAFDRAICSGPEQCASATVQGISFVPAPPE